MSAGAPRRTGRADVLIAGGGTAGHVLPAISIARALVAEGHAPNAIQFVGSRRGMEATLVPVAGFRVTLLPGRGIVRRIALVNIGAVMGLLAACALSMRLVLRVRPKVVVTVGGYASVAPALSAYIFRVPIVVVTLDAVPGAANRLIGRVAARNATAFASTPIRRAVHTGTPIRQEVLDLDVSPSARAKRRGEIGIADDQVLVVVMGGSLGAKRLNDAAVGMAQLLVERRDVVIYHVAGARDIDRVAGAAEALRTDELTALDYRLVAYDERLFDVLSCADVAIARAGASTVAELAILGTPSILVPLPHAPDDHQRRNAEVLVAAGAALVVNDEQASADVLVGMLEELIADHDRLDHMRSAALEVGIRDGARRIAKLADEVAAAPRRADRHQVASAKGEVPA